MSVYTNINLSFYCQKCKRENTFDDELINSSMRPEKCGDFELKFIKSNENNYVEYTITFKCQKCKKSGNISFKFKTNIISNDNPLYKEYECCGAKIVIQALLTGHEEENNNQNKNNPIKIQEINKRNNDANINYLNYNMNQNNIPNNNFMNSINNMNGMNGINNNMMNNNINNNANFNNMGMNNINMNNQFMPINPGNINMQYNQMQFNNFNNPLKQSQINNVNNMMNNLNINDNNQFWGPQPNLIKVNIQFGQEGNNLRFTKYIPVNKKLKDVLDEIQRENPITKKLIENIRNDILLCGGSAIDCSKTIQEINEEETIIENDCVIIVPNIKTQNFN